MAGRGLLATGGEKVQDQHQVSGCIEDVEMEKETAEEVLKVKPDGQNMMLREPRSVFSSADWELGPDTWRLNERGCSSVTKGKQPNQKWGRPK